MAKLNKQPDTTPTVAERIKSFFMPSNEANFADLRQLVESADIESAAAWCDRYGMARDLLELVAAVIAEHKRLLDEIQAGEKATGELPATVEEIRHLERIAPADIDNATATARKLLDLRKREAELRKLVSIASAAGHLRTGIEQQFAELLGLPPSRVLTGGLSNPILAWFNARGLDAYRLNGWKEYSRPSSDAAPRRRLRAIGN